MATRVVAVAEPGMPELEAALNRCVREAEEGEARVVAVRLATVPASGASAASYCALVVLEVSPGDLAAEAAIVEVEPVPPEVAALLDDVDIDLHPLGDLQRASAAPSTGTLHTDAPR